MTRNRKKMVAALLFTLAFAVTISILAYIGTFHYWQLKLSDFAHSGRNADPEIVIVAIDDATVSETEGLGLISNWDYDSFTHVLGNIKKHSPRIIAFDIYFRNERDAESATQFRDTLASTTSPVIYYRMNLAKDKGSGIYAQKSDVANPLPLQAFYDLPNITVSSSAILPDQDNVYRRIMPFIFDEKTGRYFENFSFAIARLSLNAGTAPEKPKISPDLYEMGNTPVPLENGEMIINYVSGPGSKSYMRIPFIEAYNNNFSRYGDPEILFKDKIVLIGPTAFSFFDHWLTPMSKEKFMNGIEIQANALQTILDRAFLRNLTPIEKYSLIFLLCLASTFVFMYTRIRWSLLYLAAIPTAYTLAAPVAFQNGLILDLVHPYLALITSFIAVYVYRYLTEFKQKTEMKNAFSKYVNPRLVEQLSEHPENLKRGGEKRPITVLFNDIAHFTTISEKLAPESSVALLNEYFEVMSKVVLDEGGTLDKFLGDAIMAFFGAPIAQEDHALRAVRSALKMRQELKKLVDKWQTDPPLPGGEKKPSIEARFGISSGEAIVGNIGSSERFDYTAIGDIVNQGSRLESANKIYGTSIMANRETWELVKDNVAGRSLDNVLLMGKTEPTKVYEILCMKDELTPALAGLLKRYEDGILLFLGRKFAEGLAVFEEILKTSPDDGPSKKYREWCIKYRDNPPGPDWTGVFELGQK